MSPDAKFLDDALAHWAREAPEASALQFLGETIAYATLVAAASGVAGFLAEHSVTRGDRVILMTAKSPTTIAAMYGVLRAGAIYVPIDPAAPDIRILQIIENVDPKCVLADAASRRRLTELALTVPTYDVAQMPQTGEMPTLQRSPDDGAYILHTSGTTGRPKGILHSHASGLAYARMAARLCGLAPSDRVSHHTPAYFDMSIFDVFSAGLAGATCVIIPEMYTKVPASLAQLTETAGITVWYSVPYAIQQLVERGALDKRDLSALRIVMFAGEMMPPNVVEAFSTHVPNAAFLNAYGPTETNHCVTARLSHAELDGVSALPIGQPDEGVTAEIAEDGELLIRSDQVMRGYWNEPDRNAAAFVTTASGARFYRTGDIVTKRADGALMLLGRKDRQIKLRGYRIELDEVELALTNAPNVSEAAVVFENEEITAFLSGRVEQADIQAHLAAHLPAYAHPTEIVLVPQMPRTPTGKIDRMALIQGMRDQNAA